MLIFAVCCRRPIHTCPYIPNYHHWKYVMCDSLSCCACKSWVQVHHTCAHQCQHRWCVEELIQFNHKLTLRWVAESRDRELSYIIANLHFVSPLGEWLFYFGVFLIHAWHYGRQYCIQQINQYKIEWPSHCQKWAVTLVGGLRREVSLRHNKKRLCLSHMIRWHICKKIFPELNLHLQGSLFKTWS